MLYDNSYSSKSSPETVLKDVYYFSLSSKTGRKEAITATSSLKFGDS